MGIYDRGWAWGRYNHTLHKKSENKVANHLQFSLRPLRYTIKNYLLIKAATVKHECKHTTAPVTKTKQEKVEFITDTLTTIRTTRYRN